MPALPLSQVPMPGMAGTVFGARDLL